MVAKKFIYEGKYDKADKILTREIEKGTFHSDLYYIYGELKRLEGDMQEAEFHLKNAMAAKLHTPYAYYSLGLIYMTQNQTQQAILQFR